MFHLNIFGNYSVNLSSCLKSNMALADKHPNTKVKVIINMPSIRLGGSEDKCLILKLYIDFSPGAALCLAGLHSD